MHEIARLMLTNGEVEADLPIRQVFYRQFLPSKVDVRVTFVSVIFVSL